MAVYYMGVFEIVLWMVVFVLSICMKTKEGEGRFGWLYGIGFTVLRLFGRVEEADQWEREKYRADGAALSWTMTLVPVALILSGMAGGGVTALLFPLAACMPALYMLDDVRDHHRRRLEEIAEMFPRVVTKMALLIKAGKTPNDAWNDVAEGEEGTLYELMRNVDNKIRNSVPETVAYREFTRDCGLPAAERLVTAISRNKDLGNRGLAEALQELARELWQERVILAREEGARKSNRLLIPSVMLFMSILILVAGPMLISLNL